MKATLFHNPSAGHKTDKERILSAMKLANFDVRYVSVKTDDVDQVMAKKSDLIVVAGGDGTITEILGKLTDRSIPVALLPLGTANNIARSLGVGGTPQMLVETWKIDSTQPLDVGFVKGSWGRSRFIEAFGVGVFAEFLKAADKRDKAKGAENLRQGRELFEKALKKAEPIDLSVTVDGKPIKGEFFGVEVMNVPFTGPGLPFAAKADVSDGMLDVICFEVSKRRELAEWLASPQDEAAPVTCRRGKIIEMVWEDVANRLDDEPHRNRDSKQAAEICCEEEQIQVLIPVKHSATAK